MIMSRSADYALRAMIYLARKRDLHFVPLKEIADAMRTPPFLLARLMQNLVRANLVQSMKGHHGGFRLQLDPNEINAATIVGAIMGPIRVFDCADTVECGLSTSCNLVDMFARAETALQKVFESVTLEQLARMSTAENGHSKYPVSLVLEPALLQ